MAKKQVKEILGDRTPKEFLVDKIGQGLILKPEGKTSDWVVKNQFLTERGTPLEFEDHYFLREIFDDWTPVQVILKAAQTGYSTTMILKTIYAAMKKNMNVIYCADENTELLSREGWVGYNDLHAGDYILTLDKSTGKSRFNQVREVFRRTVSMDMVELANKSFSALVTPNHRWLVSMRQTEGSPYRFVGTNNLHDHDYVIPRAVGCSQLPLVKTFSDEFVAFSGWVFTEGCYPSHHHRAIGITQKGTHVETIRKLLKILNIHYKEYRDNGKTIWHLTGQLIRDTKALFPGKMPTYEFIHKLTQEQLKLWIDAVMAGDGHIPKTGSPSFTQKSKEFTDIFMMACSLAGISVSLRKDKRETKECYITYLRQFNRSCTLELDKTIDQYKGVVWCPRTTDGTFLARRAGTVYWTGNSLPSFDDVRSFVPSKVNQMISRNKVLAEAVYGKDALDQKRIGGNFIYYRGTWSDREALMLSSDLNTHDEYDRSDQKVVAQYESRLQFSNYKGQWFFSNPSTPMSGVGLLWNKSDQKHFFFRCSRCSHVQYMDWEHSVDKERACYICVKCHKPLKARDRFKGAWVKKWEGKDISGYWMSQMMSPWLTAKDLIHQEETKSKQYFYNFVLGLPYIGTDVVVDASLILKNIAQGWKRNPKDKVIIGVDNGIIKHFVVGSGGVIFELGATKTWETIEDIFIKYGGPKGDAYLMIDALPDFTIPKRLREKYPYKVWLNYSTKDKDSPDSIKWGEGDKWGQVSSDRGKIVQETIDDLVLGEIKFAKEPYELEEYIKHWQTMYQITVKDALGIERMKWESQGADHFVFATTLYKMGVSRFTRGSSVVSATQAKRETHVPMEDIKSYIEDKGKSWLTA